MVPGGHAIMLSIALSRSIVTVARAWMQPRLSESKLHEPHVTVAFLGRNLPESVGSRMLNIAEECLPLVPKHLEFPGRFSMFGPKRNHLVGIIEPSEPIMALRSEIVRLAKEDGLRVNTTWTYRPHVTLAISGSSAPLPNAEDFRLVAGIEKLPTNGFAVKIGSEIRKVI